MAFLDSTGLNYFWGKIKSFVSASYQTKHVTRTVTLAVGSWNSNSQQTVRVTGVTTTNTLIIAPAPSSHIDYGSAQVRGVSQASGTVTFQCESEPENDLTVNITILNT